MGFIEFYAILAVVHIMAKVAGNEDMLMLCVSGCN
jgi:hypothetical protein